MPRPLPGRFLLAAVLISLTPVARGADPVDYAREVKPLLKRSCFACHGVLKSEGDLRLDSGALILKGGTEKVVVAGRSGESELIARLTSTDENLRMPQEGERLKPKEIELLKAWIDQGAKFPDDDKPEVDPADHWALRPVVRKAPPSTIPNAHPIDAFLEAKMSAAGIQPLAAADKRTVLRRVTLDLTGLPPTREELAAFVADESAEAYEKVVDRLLASPQYGERWGRHWMDIWRYSDWWGLGAEVRNSHKHIWRWRDWIVESLNKDEGYDEMVRAMLAADELYPDDVNRLRASGFLARHYFKFNRTSWLDEAIEHTSKAFLGLTFNCCKCHDHKYDPITQADYYRFRAIFEPYRVRIDQWPGEADLEKDGVSRAFDGVLDDVTYLHIRGDDRNPDKTKSLTPGIPAIFERVGLGQFDVQAVQLPPTGYQPGLRPFVLTNLVAAADAQIRTARTGVETARKALTEAEAREAAAKIAEAKPTPDKPGDTKPGEAAGVVVKDALTELNAERWERAGGEWKIVDGHLRQESVGDVRGILRLKAEIPADFEARLRFRTTGGTMWKSVGLTFDSNDSQEALVYLSAVAGGSKLQACYKQNGAYVYPADGIQSRMVELGAPQELVIRIRGGLINASVNGDATLAYKLPIARKAGRMELITYDAQAEFLGFELSRLPATVKLEESSQKPAAANAQLVTAEQARLGVTLAERVLASAELEPASLRARAAADAASAANAEAPETKELVRQAVIAERRIAAAKQAEEVVRAEIELAKTEAAKKADVEKKVAAAREAATKAVAAIDTPDGMHTPLRGGLKTVESPTESQESARKPFPTASTGRRTALARWITDPRNPLTPRVAINHIWSRHFGKPLVPAVFDFGRRSPQPEQAELLDYLASELMSEAKDSAPSNPGAAPAWRMKRIHRLIVTSAAYRRTSSSRGADSQVARDAENRLYWRMNPVRMESQVVRDALLALSGTLDRTIGGPPVNPMSDASSTRRSLYFIHSHNDHHKFLSMFDDASVLDCYRRTESIVPQQALALSNSDFALAAAERINTQLHEKLGDVDNDRFIAAAFEMVLAGTPTGEELTACRTTLAELVSTLEAAKQADTTRRARKVLIQSLLNHNDFVTIR